MSHIPTVEERLALIEDILFAHERHNDGPVTCCQAGDCACSDGNASEVGHAVREGVLAAIDGLTDIANDPNHEHRLLASESLLGHALALVKT